MDAWTQTMEGSLLFTMDDQPASRPRRPVPGKRGCPYQGLCDCPEDRCRGFKGLQRAIRDAREGRLLTREAMWGEGK